MLACAIVGCSAQPRANSTGTVLTPAAHKMRAIAHSRSPLVVLRDAVDAARVLAPPLRSLLFLAPLCASATRVAKSSGTAQPRRAGASLTAHDAPATAVTLCPGAPAPSPSRTGRHKAPPVGNDSTPSNPVGHHRAHEKRRLKDALMPLCLVMSRAYLARFGAMGSIHQDPLLALQLPRKACCM